jgi:hypothetical protein
MKSSLTLWPKLFGRCAMLSVFLLSTLSVFAHDLYWTEQKIIRASDIDGSNVVTVFDGSELMDGLAVDVVATATHIYWTDHAGASDKGGVWRANRDGSGAQRLVVNNGSFNAPHYLAIDEANGRLFFSDYTRGIFRADLADGQNVTAVADEYSAPPTYTGIVQTAADRILFLTASNSWIYQVQFSEWSAGWPSALANIQGGNATYGLAYDEVSQTVYFTDFNGGTLRSYNLGTGEANVLQRGLTSPLGVKFSPSRTHLLIAERNKGISAYQFSNGGYDLLVSTAAHFGVAVTADPAQLPDPPPPPADGDPIFVADFEADTPGSLPRLVAEGGVWTGWVPRTTPEAVYVVKDEENLFGYGTDNQFLRVDNAIGSYMDAYLSVPSEVVTLSFDFIARRTTVTSTGSERNGFGFFGGGVRQHLYSVNGTGSLRSGTGNQPVNQRARVDVLLNNSTQDVDYVGPDGAVHTLPSVYSAIWIDGNLLSLHEATSGRVATAAAGVAIDYVRLPHFSSTDRYSIDMDNITVFMGAHVMKPLVEVEPAPYRLQPVWALAPGARDYITTGSRQRGLGYNPTTGHLIVAHRPVVPTGEPAVAMLGVMDAATGAHVGTLSNTGITGGTFVVNHVAVAEDGAIYAANLTTDTLGAAGPLKVYRWADESAEPVLVYEGDPSRGSTIAFERRYGDTLAIRGSGLDTQILLAPRFGKNVTILTPAGSMNTFVDNLIVTDITDNPAGWLTHGLAFGEGNTFFGKRQPQTGSTGVQRGLVEVSFDLATGSGEVVRILEPNVFPNDIGPIGIDVARQLLVGVDSYAFETNPVVPRPAEVMLFDFSALSATVVNHPLDSRTFGPENLNGNGAGQVVFGDNDMVYVLDTDNGIAAFRITSVAAGEGFADWQEQFFPGETDPAVVGPNADPDGDGIPNLIEYALGLDPTSPNREGLPFLDDLETIGDETYLTFTFVSPDGVGDVGYSVKVGSELGGAAAEAEHVRSVAAGDGYSAHTYRDVEPIDSNDRRFMWLEVELQ